MKNRKVAVLQHGGNDYGHIEETVDGELIIQVTAIPIGWNGAMLIKLIATPQGPQAERLFGAQSF